MRLSDLELIGVGVTAFVLFVWAGDWLMPACAVTLWACLRLTQTHDRLYVLPAAIAFQWSQTSLGVFYNGFTGRKLLAISGSDYRPMVVIGLGCVLALAAGVHLGLKTRKAPDPEEARPDFAFTFPPLIAAYVGGVLVEGTLLAIAPSYPSLRQIITTFDTARLGHPIHPARITRSGPGSDGARARGPTARRRRAREPRDRRAALPLRGDGQEPRQASPGEAPVPLAGPCGRGRLPPRHHRLDRTRPQPAALQYRATGA